MHSCTSSSKSSFCIVGGNVSIDNIGRNRLTSNVGVGGISSYSVRVFPLRRLSRLDVFGKDNAGDDNGGVISAGPVLASVGGANVKCDEIASDRRWVCLEVLFGGIEVRDEGDPGGDDGNGSLAGKCSDGIDSK
jgi:hypothetical protein